MNNVVNSLIKQSEEENTHICDPQKLVELTVRECLKVLTLKEKHPVSNHHWEAIGREVSYFVREHFGVSE